MEVLTHVFCFCCYSSSCHFSPFFVITVMFCDSPSHVCCDVSLKETAAKCPRFSALLASHLPPCHSGAPAAAETVRNKIVAMYLLNSWLDVLLRGPCNQVSQSVWPKWVNRIVSCSISCAPNASVEREVSAHYVQTRQSYFGQLYWNEILTQVALILVPHLS